MSQGQIEWFDEDEFLKHHSERAVVRNRRIATQRITGVDEKYRIVACISEKNIYFADSTNSLHIDDNSSYKLEFLLGVLNSSLYQWRFKLTSTNNNVATNQLESLPFPAIDFENEASKALHDSIADLVVRVVALTRESRDAKSEQEISMKGRLMENFKGQIDQQLFTLLGVVDTSHVLRIESSVAA